MRDWMLDLRYHPSFGYAEQDPEAFLHLELQKQRRPAGRGMSSRTTDEIDFRDERDGVAMGNRCFHADPGLTGVLMFALPSSMLVAVDHFLIQKVSQDSSSRYSMEFVVVQREKPSCPFLSLHLSLTSF